MAEVSENEASDEARLETSTEEEETGAQVSEETEAKSIEPPAQEETGITMNPLDALQELCDSFASIVIPGDDNHRYVAPTKRIKSITDEKDEASEPPPELTKDLSTASLSSNPMEADSEDLEMDDTLRYTLALEEIITTLSSTLDTNVIRLEELQEAGKDVLTPQLETTRQYFNTLEFRINDMEQCFHQIDVVSYAMQQIDACLQESEKRYLYLLREINTTKNYQRVSKTGAKAQPPPVQTSSGITQKLNAWFKKVTSPNAAPPLSAMSEENTDASTANETQPSDATVDMTEQKEDDEPKTGTDVGKLQTMRSILDARDAKIRNDPFVKRMEWMPLPIPDTPDLWVTKYTELLKRKHSSSDSNRSDSGHMHQYLP